MRSFHELPWHVRNFINELKSIVTVALKTASLKMIVSNPLETGYQEIIMIMFSLEPFKQNRAIAVIGFSLCSQSSRTSTSPRRDIQ